MTAPVPLSGSLNFPALKLSGIFWMQRPLVSSLGSIFKLPCSQSQSFNVFRIRCIQLTKSSSRILQDEYSARGPQIRCFPSQGCLKGGKTISHSPWALVCNSFRYLHFGFHIQLDPQRVAVEWDGIGSHCPKHFSVTSSDPYILW